MIDTTLASQNPLRFRKNIFLEKISNLIMTLDDKTRDEKLQYDVNREAAKISALSSGKIDDYEYLTGEEILPSDQGRIKEQPKLKYFPLGKAFEKEIATIESQGKKQTKTLEEHGKQPVKSNVFTKDDKLSVRKKKRNIL